MQIGAKLRELRLAKSLSQGDIQNKTGLFRCYTSRVEHGHTVPSIETLEKYAHALEIPLYRLFTDQESVRVPKLRQPKITAYCGVRVARNVKDFRSWRKAFLRMDEQDRKLLLSVGEGMARRGAKR